MLWQQIVPDLIVKLQSGSAAQRQLAYEDLMRLARAMDRAMDRADEALHALQDADDNTQH